MSIAFRCRSWQEGINSFKRLPFVFTWSYYTSKCYPAVWQIRQQTTRLVRQRVPSRHFSCLRHCSNSFTAILNLTASCDGNERRRCCSGSGLWDGGGADHTAQLLKCHRTFYKSLLENCQGKHWQHEQAVSPPMAGLNSSKWALLKTPQITNPGKRGLSPLTSLSDQYVPQTRTATGQNVVTAFCSYHVSSGSLAILLISTLTNSGASS